MRSKRSMLLALAAVIALLVPLVASAAPTGAQPKLLATLTGGAGSGSAIGPGGALYVPQPAAGEIWRIDPKSGAKTLYASGLPQRFRQLPFGGVMDVAFIGSTAYALVSVVGSVFPDDLFACHPGTIGLYRIDGPTSSTVVADIGTADVASGARLAVDVEMGRGRTLFALAQGHFSCDDPACAGSPADPGTGALMKANADRTFTTVADALDRPTSLEIVGTTAYVITLNGEIWRIDDISGPPYG